VNERQLIFAFLLMIVVTVFLRHDEPTSFRGNYFSPGESPLLEAPRPATRDKRVGWSSPAPPLKR
jgi:hypothetical protein